MTKRQKFDEAGDNQELQALFDSMAGGGVEVASPAAPPPRLEVVSPTPKDGDNDELQALFDSVASDAEDKQAESPKPGGADEAGQRTESVYNRIGIMTRKLHDALRELGYDRGLQESAHAIPDARQRLTYIAEMTEQAASKVLNATDIAKPIQDQVMTDAASLRTQWDRLYAKDLTPEEFRDLAGRTRDFLGEVVNGSRETSDQLLQIMMAQDFQDLTGQVIKKVVELAHGLEKQLLEVLIDAMPEERKAEAPEGLMNGPVINAVGRDDVVTNQSQVDDLLESLGF